MARYVDSESRAEDNLSSAWTLIIVGIIGCILLILVAVGVVPFPVNGPGKYLVYSVLAVFCLIFVVAGIVSFKKGKAYSVEATAEKSREQRIIDWCHENDIANKIDERLGADFGDMPQEEVFFHRSALLKKTVFMAFQDMGYEFIDHVTDEIYDNLFED